MNITLLIGNGFDRNLGLATLYSDFVKMYKTAISDSKNINLLKEYMIDNEELWSSAEIAMGKFTEKLEAGSGEAFSECHVDFCEKLAEYLVNQEKRIEYEKFKSQISKSFLVLNKLIDIFPTQEKNGLNQLYKKHVTEDIIFNFICYNYTETLDKCLEIFKSSQVGLGSHMGVNRKYYHRVGDICHVHGTVNKEMVFGVNDDSQISKNEVFNCEDGDLYKNILIKQSANASYMENTDAKAAKILRESHLIFIYGMSLGETDRLWWERICVWLSENKDHQLILHCYDAPKKNVLPIAYQVFERRQRQKITQYSQLDSVGKKAIESQIHITGINVFAEISNIAK